MTTPVKFTECGNGTGGMKGSLAELAYDATGGDPLLALHLALDIVQRRHPDHVRLMRQRERQRTRRAA